MTDLLVQIDDLIKEGETLAPKGGDSFGGYNGELQPDYISWQTQCFAVFDSLGPRCQALRHGLKTYLDDKRSVHFYKDQAYSLLGLLKGARRLVALGPPVTQQSSDAISKPELECSLLQQDVQGLVEEADRQIWQLPQYSGQMGLASSILDPALDIYRRTADRVAGRLFDAFRDRYVSRSEVMTRFDVALDLVEFQVVSYSHHLGLNATSGELCRRTKEEARTRLLTRMELSSAGEEFGMAGGQDRTGPAGSRVVVSETHIHGSQVNLGAGVQIQGNIVTAQSIKESRCQSPRAPGPGAETPRVPVRSLRLVPRNRQCWWHLAKQQDSSFLSQIHLEIEAANLTSRPVRIVNVRLIRPGAKGDPVYGDVLLPMAGSPYYSDKHPVPPSGTVTAFAHIYVSGALAPQGKPLRVTLGITDQYGEEYRLKGVTIQARDPVLPKLTRAERLKELDLATKPGSDKASRPLPEEWQHGGRFEGVDLVLNEEKRSYAACGRTRGGLGSLNVGLQSEPNFGWTTPGSVPLLLWDKGQGSPVGSKNLARLMKLHEATDDAGKDSLERYLLSHLHKDSPYADVAYFTFLALHRMARTVDALMAARASLAGDKVYGYSNLLGTLSAIVSHEHFAIERGIYPRILEALEGDTEDDFRLREKINLARLQDY